MTRCGYVERRKAHKRVMDKAPIRCVKLPPEFGDGQHYEVLDLTDLNDAASIAASRLAEWLAEATTGESVEIEVIELTRKELEALPDL